MRSPFPILILAASVSSIMMGACTEGSDQPGSQGGAASNRSPSIQSVTIQPSVIRLDEPVSVHVQATDPDFHSVTYRYKWSVNGSPVNGLSAPSISSEYMKRGDIVAVEVVATDGKSDSAPMNSTPVTVGNTPPTVKGIVLEPNPVKAGLPVRVTVETSDLDKDDVALLYRWWKNKQLVGEGESNVFETKTLARGDELMVSVVPSDGSGKGKEAFSEPLVFANSPPTVTSTPPNMPAQGQYEYVVAASDPEQDAVTFSLQAAPSGMTIDAQTGRITWTVPAGAAGAYHVKVVVEDTHHSGSFQEFDLVPPLPRAS